MKSVSGKEFAKVLERNGWALLRVQGSHHIYGKSGSDVRLSVPIHANRSLKTGLLKHLLKMARLSEDAL
ncbi:MAG: type II toxin-antitoxin system HicA family toxin [Candidatus Rokuibacteriota bacterium]